MNKIEITDWDNKVIKYQYDHGKNSELSIIK